MDEGNNQPVNVQAHPKPKCGIIMPISSIDDLSADHWLEVLNILKEACNDANFEGELVSTSDEVGIIQKTIIDNLYNNDMVICDISGKNPNVLIELGIRLTFDKPTIIVTDDLKSLPFDTAMIQHLDYPRDLRFTKIVAFKKRLAEKIVATHERKKANPEFSPFLKHFGEFVTPALEQKELSANQYIFNKLQSIELSLSKLNRNTTKTITRTNMNFATQVEIDTLVYKLFQKMQSKQPDLTPNFILSEPGHFKNFADEVNKQLISNTPEYEIFFSRSEIDEFVATSLEQYI